jgi:MFS family permease
LRPLVLLLRRPIAVLWTSQVLSAIGDQLYAIAVLWIAVNVAGPRAGFVAAAQTIAKLVCGVIGGVYADRWNRRTTMIIVDVMRAAAVAVLIPPAMQGTLQLWHLMAVSTLVGALSALFDPSLQASLQTITHSIDDLAPLNGLMDMTRRLARVAGPGLAAALAGVLPLAHFFSLDAVSFIVSAAALVSLGSRYTWKAKAPIEKHVGQTLLRAEMSRTLGLLREHAPLSWGLVTIFIMNLAWAIAFTVGAPLMAKNVLAGELDSYGLIVTLYGVGNVAGNLVVGSLAIQRRTTFMFVGRIVLGAGFIVFGAAHDLTTALIGSAVAAIGGPMGDIMFNTMMQIEIPPDSIGKVYSLRMVLENAGASLGLVFASFLFDHLSIAATIWTSSLVMLASGVAGLMRFGGRK